MWLGESPTDGFRISDDAPRASTTLLSIPVAVRDAQTASDLCLWRQRFVTKKQRSARVLTRVLRVCLPIFIRT